MKKYNIGVIGKGFVGSAVAHGFSAASGYGANVRIYDKDPKRSKDSLEEVVYESDFIFISVPTPSNTDGSINLEILTDCIKEVEEVSKKNTNNSPIILVRSTVVPGTTRTLKEQHSSLKIVFNPEFLTERQANFDFISQSRFILGGDKELTGKVANLFRDRFGSSVSIIETDYESAELTKYVCNVFFATKVSFLNEMKLISDKINANWNDVMEGVIRDGRVGNSHTQVPGPDGKFGYGGSCFPKDVQALIHFGQSLGLDMSIVKGGWQTNLKVRPEKDWEKLLGRSVVVDD
jgi:UDPglucose 6-dehydrogenase